MRRHLMLLSVICAVALGTTGCEDNGVNARPEDRLDIFASPEEVTIDIAAGDTSGTTTIIAQLFDASGFTGSGLNVFFTADGGILHSLCVAGKCEIGGARCAVDTECAVLGTEAIETDSNGFAEVQLTLETIDPDPTTVTASSGSINNSVAVSKIEDTGNLPPVAVIDLDPPSAAMVNDPIIFDGTLSDDPDGDIFCYQWEITSSIPGNNEFVQGVSARQFTRSYRDEQRLTVILRVSDDPAIQAVCSPVPPDPDPADPNRFNGSDSVSYDVVCDPTPPVANAGSNQVVILDDTQVEVFLNGSLSSDPESLIVDYEWDCRNGEIVSGERPSCIYTRAQIYDVVLVVTNGCGETDSDEVEIRVQLAP